MNANFLAVPNQDLAVQLQLFGERENPNLQQPVSVIRWSEVGQTLGV